MDERIVPTLTTSVHAGTPATLYSDINFLVDGSEEYGPFAITSTSTPEHGTVAFLGTAVTLTPNAGFVGTESITFSIGDGLNHNASGLMIFEFTNTAPTVANYDVYVHAGTVATVTPTFSDPDNDSVSITGVGTSEHGTVALNNGVITFTPTSNFVGDATFTYTVSDGNSNGTVDGTITVHVLNQPPVPLNYSFTAHAGNTVVIMPDMLVDPDGDYTTIVGIGTPGFGNTTLNSGNAIVYTPKSNYVGIDSFNYVLSDGLDSGIGTIAITFTNTPPTASDATINVTRGVTLTGNVLTDATDVDGDTLTATVLTNPTHGTLTLNSDGTYSYEPASDYLGTESFQVTISDGNNGTVIKTVNLIIADEYGNLSEPPVAEDVTIDLYGGEAAQIPYLATNVNPSGGPIMLHSVSYSGNTLYLFSGGTLSTEHGTVSIGEEGLPIFTPNDPEWEGTDTFAYRVINAVGAISAPKTMFINLTPVPMDVEVETFDISFVPCAQDVFIHTNPLNEIENKQYPAMPIGLKIRLEIETIYTDEELGLSTKSFDKTFTVESNNISAEYVSAWFASELKNEGWEARVLKDGRLKVISGDNHTFSKIGSGIKNQANGIQAQLPAMVKGKEEMFDPVAGIFVD